MRQSFSVQLPSPIACCISLACVLAAVGCGRAPQAHTTGPRTASAAPSPKATAPARLNDSDHDGIPDGAELYSYDDRENFRRWFTMMAEMQFYQPSDEWNTEQRDCAGLIRFSWREALRSHDRLWFQRMGPGYERVAPDVRAYDLAKGVLGEMLFRTAYGSFKESDLDGKAFSQFADARTLKNFNTVFVSRDRRQAEAGDLLFFYQPWVQKFPFHVMLFLGKPRVATEGAADWVVYHTGAAPEDGGTVKKVRLSVLDQHPDKRWRPLPNNPNFLGFYRLKILD
ncbi:MAG TPA: DUF1175 family protein [Pyrinomonadaceae bacterium]